LPTLSEDDFAACAIDPQARPETLSVKDFVNLSNQARKVEG